MGNDMAAQNDIAGTRSPEKRSNRPNHRLSQMNVRVVSRGGQCLFQWAGPAHSPADAENMAMTAYTQATKAVIKTYQLREADFDKRLRAAGCTVREIRTPTRWKLGHNVLWTASSHRKAVLTGLNRDDTQSLLNAAIAADPTCFDALLNRKTVTASLWVHRIASDGMSEIDHAITIDGDASPMKRKVADRSLRDALRILALRALCQFPDAIRPVRGQVAYARQVTLTGSATLLAATKSIYGALKPDPLITWLQDEGHDDLAAELERSFAA